MDPNRSKSNESKISTNETKQVQMSLYGSKISTDEPKQLSGNIKYDNLIYRSWLST